MARSTDTRTARVLNAAEGEAPPGARRYGPEFQNPYYAPLPLPGTGRSLLADKRLVPSNVDTLVDFVRLEAGAPIQRISNVFGCPCEAVRAFAEIGMREGRLATGRNGWLVAS